MSRLSNLPPGVTDQMIEENAGYVSGISGGEPQPFDPGYDYEADKAIEDRLDAAKWLWLPDHTKAAALMDEAAGEIRALRLLIKNMERTINNLLSERQAQEECEI